MSVRLHVNIDHVATVRNARGTVYPDGVAAARICIASGADGITAHLREDRRHVRDDDVDRLRAVLRGPVFNLEMAATDEMVGIATRVKPEVVTLVPERREERTTEGGLDVVGGGANLKKRIATLREAGIKVSLFIAADDAQLEASVAVGARQIELHTGEYCHAFTQGDDAATEAERARLALAAKRADAMGLEVAAGHGLTRGNVGKVVAIPEICELNIGHAMIADALFFSMAGAVEAMREAIRLWRVLPAEAGGRPSRGM